MNTRLGFWRIVSLVLILLVLLGCASLGSIQPTNTPVPSGGGNSSAGSSGDSKNNPSNPNNPNNSTTIATLQDTATPEVTLTPTPETSAGPYMVRQTMTAGKEKLGSPAGGVCVNVPWQVSVDTPQVSFMFVFGGYRDHPGSAGNSFGYAYNISSAGESHQAQGTYTLSQNKDGSTKVTIRGSDHVVFKGFDGKMPVLYSFDLVPVAAGGTCH